MTVAPKPPAPPAAPTGGPGGPAGPVAPAGPPATSARLWIDGKTFEVERGRNLLHACLSLGLDVPYFCWHPELGSVGACRQCAVKQYRDQNDTRGRLVMACMTGADDGVRISIDDAEAKEFRAEVVEWLMTNHPHDCPVCDEGGECHLQDMTVMTGHAARRFRFPKRTFRNQDLGPFINHEMNRCITCYRCVRFYKDYAGGRDLDAQAVHNSVYFGRHQDGVLESEFSGNLVEVCPTGVFTDKTLKSHYTRKWDLTSAPSVCVHCAVGCNVLASERQGEMRRILNRYHSEINGYFLCDRGRFGYEFVNRPDRVLEPLLRSASGALAHATPIAALDRFAELLARGRVYGIASPRASLESSFALERVVGASAFSRGIHAAEAALLDREVAILASGPAASASLEDVRRSDAVLILGEDPTMTAPVLALALRQAALVAPAAAAPRDIPRWHDAAVREWIGTRRGPFFIASTLPTRLDDVATRSIRLDTGAAAELAQAVARAITQGGAIATGSRAAGGSTETERLAIDIAAALSTAQRPLIVAGTASGDGALLDAAAAVAIACGERARIALTAPECNSVGSTLLGGASLEDAFAAIERGEVETLVVVENDLYRRASRARVDQALARVPHLVVLDHYRSPTLERAELVLPAATFAEGDGTMVSSEGRAQRYFQVCPPRVEGPRESWRWLGEGAGRAGLRAAGPWLDIAAVAGAMALEHRALGLAGEMSAAAEELPPGARRVPRQSHRLSGRTAILADRTVHEPAPPTDPDSPFVFSMEGQPVPAVPGKLLPLYWWPRWNSVQSLNKFLSRSRATAITREPAGADSQESLSRSRATAITREPAGADSRESQEEVGGRITGGVRLLEPGSEALLPHTAATAGAAAAPRGDRAALSGVWRIVAAPQIFGSEELSSAAPAVAERSPKPFLLLGAEDAEAIAGGSGGTVELWVGGETLRLPVTIELALPRGMAALPVGLSGLPFIALPASGEVRKP